MRDPATLAAAQVLPQRGKKKERERERKKEESLKRGVRAHEFTMGWTGGEVLAGRNRRNSPTPASSRQVARRSHTSVAGSPAAKAGSSRAPGAASAAGLPPLGSGSAGVRLPASGCSGLRCSVELPAPMASLQFSRAQPPGYAFSKSQGRRAEPEALRSRGPKSAFLSRSSSERAQTANAGDALAANSLEEEEEKKSHLFASSSPLFFPRFIT